MNYEIFKEIVHGRRSIRKFTEQEVSVQDIEEIIDCARYAPSDTNSQTWEFIVIMNRDKIKDIENMTWEALHKLADQVRKRTVKRKQENCSRVPLDHMQRHFLMHRC